MMARRIPSACTASQPWTTPSTTSASKNWRTPTFAVSADQSAQIEIHFTQTRTVLIPGALGRPPEPRVNPCRINRAWALLTGRPPDRSDIPPIGQGAEWEQSHPSALYPRSGRFGAPFFQGRAACPIETNFDLGVWTNRGASVIPLPATVSVFRKPHVSPFRERDNSSETMQADWLWASVWIQAMGKVAKGVDNGAHRSLRRAGGVADASNLRETGLRIWSILTTRSYWPGNICRLQGDRSKNSCQPEQYWTHCRAVRWYFWGR